MKAGDVMTMGAATVGPEATLAEAARLLIEHHISGLPVIDSDGRLIGLVTEHDFLRQHDGTRRRWLDALLAEQGGQITARELHERRVVNVMSWGPVSVHVDTPIEETVELMHRHRVATAAGRRRWQGRGDREPSEPVGSLARPARAQASKLASFNLSCMGVLAF